MSVSLEKSLTRQPRAIVSGASGYVGSRLVGAMVGAGWDVHAYIRANSDLQLLAAVMDQVTCHIVECDAPSLVASVAGIRPDIIIHLASLVSVEHSSGEIEALIDSNVTYGTSLLEAAVSAGVKCFINTGTVWEYRGEKDRSPVCLYAASKRAFEEIIRFYESAYDIKVVTLSLSDTYGPEDPRKKITNLILDALETGELLKLSPGDQRMDFVYIDDVSSAFLLTANTLVNKALSGSLTGRYEVCTQKLTSLKDLVRFIETLSGGRLNVEWGGRKYRKREVLEPYFVGQCLPNWKPLVNLELGLLKLIRARNSKH